MRILLEGMSLDQLKEAISKEVIKDIKRNDCETELELKKKPTDQLLTRKETAGLLKVSLVTLHSWTKQGIIPAYRIGNRIRYKSEEVAASLKKVRGGESV